MHTDAIITTLILANVILYYKHNDVANEIRQNIKCIVTIYTATKKQLLSEASSELLYTLTTL